ncbi:MAG: hypothetical protein ACREGJ_02925 [Candidatus Saccharimonadales bacterium]
MVECLTIEPLVSLFGAVGVVVKALVDAGTLLSWLRSELDLDSDKRNGRSKYEVLVTRSDSNGKFIGTWSVHGFSVQIRAGGTGRAAWHNGLCDPDDWETTTICWGEGTVKWKVEGDRLTFTFTSARITEEDTDARPRPDVESYRKIGDSLTYVYLRPGLLKEVGRNPGGGNVYLCGDGLDQDERTRLCNA